MATNLITKASRNITNYDKTNINTSTSVIFKVEGCLVVTVNMTLIFMILHVKKLRKKFNNIFLVNLLLCHAVVGVIAICLFEDDLVKTVLNVQHLSAVVTMLSCLSNVPVTADRFVATNWPYFYPKLTRRKSIFFCVLTWILTVILTAITLQKGLQKKVLDIVTVSFIAVMVIILILANAFIYNVVHKQIVEIKKTCVKNNTYMREDSKGVIDTQHGLDSNDEHNRKDYQQNSNTARLQAKQVRAAQICAGVVTSYCILWLPLMIHDFLKMFRIGSSFVYPGSIYPTIALFLSLSNSLVDPIIYILLNRELKTEWKKRFVNWKRRRLSSRTYNSKQ
ncbi:alpha-1A adrenergic receptor-like [Hydractinia symbiolongicarpus]|uniref:alpha-1A adrenergic receptor-like n=1 Tax=Hydractinia symbiolongicarpus TaxID=13093 RepID=UPI00254C4AC1|nr:alpha-1A adrenergic receptor-like [Hydractinia symbiolongicarpus]